MFNPGTNCNFHFEFVTSLFLSLIHISFEQFTSWFMFDEEKGYHTCSYLGRIARTSDQLSEEENELENERAIDEILKYDFRNIYKKVVQKT